MAIIRKGQPGITRIVPHWQNRRFAVPESIGPVNLLLVGDSWTDDTYSHGQYPATWPTGDRITVVNEGVSSLPISAAAGGSNSMESTVAGHLSSNPETDICVVCSGGINDFSVSVTNDEITDAAKAIYASITAAGAKMVMVGLPRSSSWVSNGNNGRAEDIEEEYRSWFSARGVPFVPLKPLISNDSGIYTAYAEDPLHLNEEGAAVLGQAILQAVKATKYRKAGAV